VRSSRNGSVKCWGDIALDDGPAMALTTPSPVPFERAASRRPEAQDPGLAIADADGGAGAGSPICAVASPFAEFR